MTNKVCCIYPGPVFSDDLNHVAGSGRLVNLAQLISQSGFDVTILSLENQSNLLNKQKENISYVQLKQSKERFNKSNTIVSFLEANKFECVLFYGTTIKYTYSLRKYCKQKNIRFIQSVNEWGRFTLKAIVSYLLLKVGLFTARKSDGLILISNYMMSKFKKVASGPIIKIPSIFDLGEFEQEIDTNSYSKIRIAYAGSISNNKDILGNLLVAYDQMSESLRERIEFYFYGPTYEALLRNVNDESVLTRNMNVIHFSGYLSRNLLRKELVKNNFTVLLRPKLPYSEAGFPTKFGESMILGLPVIANLTSDLGEYLVSGQNGFVCNSESVEDVKKVLEVVATLNSEQLFDLKKNAFKSGELFDLKHYVNSMKDFMERI